MSRKIFREEGQKTPPTVSKTTDLSPPLSSEERE